MEYSNVIVFIMIIVLMLFVFVTMVNFIIPFKMKSDFDDISSSYHMLVQLEGGMSITTRNQLEKDLSDLGMSDITIICKSIDEVRYGERFKFYVSANIDTKLPSKYLVFEKEEETIEFQRVSFSKKLVN